MASLAGLNQNILESVWVSFFYYSIWKSQKSSLRKMCWWKKTFQYILVELKELTNTEIKTGILSEHDTIYENAQQNLLKWKQANDTRTKIIDR